jgi:hypothetical protein
MLMPPESPLSAVPVRLDLANERLWYGDQVRILRPKTFALLRYLVAHPGQLQQSRDNGVRSRMTSAPPAPSGFRMQVALSMGSGAA